LYAGITDCQAFAKPLSWGIMETTDDGPQTTDHRRQTTDDGPQTTDHRRQTTDDRPQTTDDRPLTADD